MNSYAIHQLQKNTALGKTIKEALIKEFGEDDELIADMIEGETSIDVWLPKVFDVREDIRALRAANKAQREALKDRDLVLEKREEAIIRVIMKALLLTPDNKVETAYGLRYLSKRRSSLIIDDENLIPSRWYVTPEPPPPRLDKQGMTRALQDDVKIPGCRLGVEPGNEYTYNERGGKPKESKS